MIEVSEPSFISSEGSTFDWLMVTSPLPPLLAVGPSSKKYLYAIAPPKPEHAPSRMQKTHSTAVKAKLGLAFVFFSFKGALGG